MTAWIGQGISFQASDTQRLSTGNIPLDSRSFTIEFWFYATNLSAWDNSFMGQYRNSSANQCLYINIRNGRLILGFFSDNLQANTTIIVNRWYHAAFAYDHTIKTKYIYLNGILDGQSIGKQHLLATSVPFTVGGARIGGTTSLDVYYSGIIDQLVISNRTKKGPEIYINANLACYLTFDCISLTDDSGPNNLQTTNYNGKRAIGRFNQGIRFSSMNSYITIGRLSVLTDLTRSFSIMMWVNPMNINGPATIIHTSNQFDGMHFSD